jgi:hypothetical protein
LRTDAVNRGNRPSDTFNGPRISAFLFREINSNFTGIHMKKREADLRVTIVMPQDCKDYLLRQAERRWTSMNAEANFLSDPKWPIDLMVTASLF